MRYEVYKVMNTPKRLLFAGFLVLTVGVGGHVAVAGGAQAGTTQLINQTITHLEAALKSVNANDLAAATLHVKEAGQSSKLILGGSFEARKQGGSRAITKSRLELEKGNVAGASDALKEALDGFKSLIQPDKTGNQGGL